MFEKLSESIEGHMRIQDPSGRYVYVGAECLDTAEKMLFDLATAISKPPVQHNDKPDIYGFRWNDPPQGDNGICDVIYDTPEDARKAWGEMLDAGKIVGLKVVKEYDV